MPNFQPSLSSVRKSVGAEPRDLNPEAKRRVALVKNRAVVCMCVCLRVSPLQKEKDIRKHAEKDVLSLSFLAPSCVCVCTCV